MEGSEGRGEGTMVRKVENGEFSVCLSALF